jgi:NAD(P)-dependent dehydrogenase (short-subunit alcohol dehydrogenase family)
VNAINPGWVDTDMARSGINAIASGTGGSFEDALKGQMDQVPLGKMSAPSEIAELIYLLLDAKQTSITGQTLDINNGALMN